MMMMMMMMMTDAVITRFMTMTTLPRYAHYIFEFAFGPGFKLKSKKKFEEFSLFNTTERTK